MSWHGNVLTALRYLYTRQLRHSLQTNGLGSSRNIAEGYKRIGKADKLHFFNIAQGSLEECRCYIYLSKDVGYIDDSAFCELYTCLEEASKMLNWYCKGIRNNAYNKDED